MGSVINFGQMLEIEMRINLSGADIGVAQHFLHCAQVAAGLQYMRGETVAQHMRMHIAADALAYGQLLDAILYSTPANSAAAHSCEHG